MRASQPNQSALSRFRSVLNLSLSMLLLVGGFGLVVIRLSQGWPLWLFWVGMFAMMLGMGFTLISGYYLQRDQHGRPPEREWLSYNRWLIISSVLLAMIAIVWAAEKLAHFPCNRILGLLVGIPSVWFGLYPPNWYWHSPPMIRSRSFLGDNGARAFGIISGLAIILIGSFTNLPLCRK